MLVNEFSDRVVSGQVNCDRGVFIVTGKLHMGHREGTMIHFRSAEPADLRLATAGSALPYPNTQMAFGPVNSGQVVPDKYGKFKFQVFSPNSYYLDDDIMNGVGQGKILVPPMIKMTVVLANGDQLQYDMDLSNVVPLRSLTNMPGKHVRSTGRNTPSYFL